MQETVDIDFVSKLETCATRLGIKSDDPSKIIDGLIEKIDGLISKKSKLDKITNHLKDAIFTPGRYNSIVVYNPNNNRCFSIDEWKEMLNAM